MRKSAKEEIVDIKINIVGKRANFRHKKTCRSRFFIQADRSKHAGRRYIFKSLAVLLEHAFQDFAHFHCVLQFFVLQVLLVMGLIIRHPSHKSIVL